MPSDAESLGIGDGDALALRREEGIPWARGPRPVKTRILNVRWPKG